MAKITRGRNNDEAVQAIKDALDAYEGQHPGAEASLYRQNVASIRLRVIDQRFEGMSRSRRHEDIWGFLAARVPQDALSEVSLVLGIPPSELGEFMNLEFDDPSPSLL